MEITQRPIRFSTSMVQAILAHKKILGGRVVNKLSGFGKFSEFGKSDPPGYDPVNTFTNLWNSIKEKRGHGWWQNPWGWIAEFEQAEKPTIE